VINVQCSKTSHLCISATALWLCTITQKHVVNLIHVAAFFGHLQGGILWMRVCWIPLWIWPKEAETCRRFVTRCISLYLIIVPFLITKPTRCTNFSNLFLEWNSTCFGQFLCPSSGVFYFTHNNGICHTGLLTVCSQAVNKPVWHTPLLRVQWKTHDNGQRNCPKHVEFHSKNKFLKLVHLVGFIIRNLTRCTVTWTLYIVQLLVYIWRHRHSSYSTGTLSLFLQCYIIPD
jgi:hypothetical protein